MWSLRRRSKTQPETDRRRRVILVRHDGDLIVTDAYTTQAGWIARWIDSDSAWSLLRPSGRVEGTSTVVGWLPYSGWPEIVADSAKTNDWQAFKDLHKNST